MARRHGRKRAGLPKRGLRAVRVPLLTFLCVCTCACSEGDAPPAPAPPAAPARTPEREAPATAPAQAPPAPAEAPPADPGALAEQGRQYYLSSCIACHNADPTLDGPLGPAVAGSAPELVEARVMRAEYPPGYSPKRDTRVMVAMPFLEKQLPALSAYLARAQKGEG